MKKLLLTLSLAMCAWGASAQPSRVITVVSKGFFTNYSLPGIPISGAASTFNVATNEAVRIVSLMANPVDSGKIVVRKSGVQAVARVGDVVAGPAVVVVWFAPSEELADIEGALMTLERWRVLKSSPLR